MKNKNNATYLLVVILNLGISFLFWKSWIPVLNKGVSALNFYVYITPAIITLLSISLINLMIIISSRELYFFSTLLIMLIPLLYQTAIIRFSAFASLILFIGLIISYHNFSIKKHVYKKINQQSLSQSRNIFLSLFIALSVMLAGLAQINLNKETPNFRIPEFYNKYITNISLSFLVNQLDKYSANDIAEDKFNNEIPRLRKDLANLGISDENEINKQIENARINYLENVSKINSKENLKGSVEEQIKIVVAEIEKQINIFLSKYLNELPYILALIFYLTMALFSSLFSFVSDILLLMIVKIALSLGILTIVKRTEEVEYLEI